MKTMIFLLSAVLCLACTACKNTVKQTVSAIEPKPEISSGKIQISGAFALYPLVKIWADEFQKEYPDIEFEILETGTGQGLQDILAGKADLALVSREIIQGEIPDSFWVAQVARGGVVAVFNSSNPDFDIIMKSGLTSGELLQIFTAKDPLTWKTFFENGSNQKIQAYSREDDSGAADVFAGFLNCSQNELMGIKVLGDEKMIQGIQQNKYGLGFCNLNFAFNPESNKAVEGIQILPIDLNFNGKTDPNEKMADSLFVFQRKIWAHRFPRNLCRTLCIVSQKVPENEKRLFMQWVLTEGQDFVEKAGYCELNTPEIKCKLKSLE